VSDTQADIRVNPDTLAVMPRTSRESRRNAAAGAVLLPFAPIG
jgi:hypothetical protein